MQNCSQRMGQGGPDPPNFEENQDKSFKMLHFRLRFHYWPTRFEKATKALIWYDLQICLDISTPSSSKFSRESIYSTEKICVFTYGNSQYRELQAFDLSIGTAIGCKKSKKKVVKGLLSSTFNIKLISTNNSEYYVSIKYSD